MHICDSNNEITWMQQGQLHSITSKITNWFHWWKYKKHQPQPQEFQLRFCSLTL